MEGEEYRLILSRQAVKDLEQLKRTELYDKAVAILEIIAVDPLRSPPPYKRLSGSLSHLYSRRINRTDRIVYGLIQPNLGDEDQRVIVHVKRVRSHYGGIVPILF